MELLYTRKLIMEKKKLVWTIGHSTRSIDEFLQILRSFSIKALADVRNFPGSRKFPQFNSDSLAASLRKADIGYFHFKELGGRRKPLPDSINTNWRNSAFRGYADYMQTDEFKKAVIQLEMLASESRTAFMCSEAVWWSCHRSLIADYLKANGWTVWHIMNAGKETEHPFTSPARVENGVLSYSE